MKTDCKPCISFSGLLKSVVILAILFICHSANAQTPPSSNLTGPLKAYANDSAVVITSRIAGAANPTVSYSLVNNTSGASILSKGSFNYDSATGVGTQTILVSPGSAKGSFNIALQVSTPNGTCESSKSVTVLAH